MAITSKQKSDHITNMVSATAKWLQAQNELRALRREWDAVDMGNEINDATDFTGDNEGLNKAKLAAVYTTFAAEDALMAQGHSTNLYNLTRAR